MFDLYFGHWLCLSLTGIFHVGALLLHGIYHRGNSFSDKIIQMHTFNVHTCTHREAGGETKMTETDRGQR